MRKVRTSRRTTPRPGGLVAAVSRATTAASASAARGAGDRRFGCVETWGRPACPIIGLAVAGAAKRWWHAPPAIQRDAGSARFQAGSWWSLRPLWGSSRTAPVHVRGHLSSYVWRTDRGRTARERVTPATGFARRWERSHWRSTPLSASRRLLPPFREYDERLAQVADTADAQIALAEWCEQQGLSRERLIHLRRATGA